IAEDAGRVLGEDAVARERPQQTVQCVGVGTGLLSQLGHAPWAVAERLRDPQVRDERERARDEPATERIPDDALARTTFHHRSAATAHANDGSTASGGSLRATG